MERTGRQASDGGGAPDGAGPEAGGGGDDPGTRFGAAAGAIFLPAVWLWTLRGEWRMAAPALLLVCLVGLIGGGIYRFTVERRRAPSDFTGWFVAVASTVVLVTGSAAWFSGDWRGWHTVLGAVTAGAATGCWLVFLRIALWGLPDGSD